MDTIPGLVGSNGTIGNSGANVINAVIDATILGTSAQPASTLTALDTIDGGTDADVLNINAITAVVGAAPTAIQSIFPSITVNNVETVNIRAALAFKADVSGFTGLTAANVTTAGGALDLTAAATTAVSVSGATAAVTTTGGSSVTLTKAMSLAGASTGAVVINKTGAVTVTATDSLAAGGDINIGTGVGATDAVTGAVVVTASGPKIVGGTAAYALDDILIKGGTTVSVTQAATADMGDVATAGTAANVVTQGAVTVTGGNTTTSVSVIQGDQVANVAAQVAVVGVGATSALTFKAMLTGDTVTVDGLTFTASKALTAAEAAAAFAGLTAVENQGQGYSSNGFYTGATSTNFNTGAVVGNTVTYTQKVAGTGTLAAPAATQVIGTGTLPLPVAATGLTAVTAKDGITGVLGVANGAVAVNDNAVKSITTLTVDGYSAGATLGTAPLTGSLNALTSLTLANSGGGAAAVTTTATTLALTVNDVNSATGNTGSTLTLDAGTATVKTLNVTTATKNSFVVLTAAAVTDLNVAGTNALNLTGSTLSALTTVKVSGAAGLTVDASGVNVTSVDSSATTGTVTATIDNTLATYTGGAGVDNVTFTNKVGTTKAISLAGGDDTLTVVAAGALVTPTVAIDGGAGTDTLVMASADAAAASAGYAAKFTNFEKLSLGVTATGGTDTVDLSVMNNYNYVISAGMTGTGALVLTKMANSGTLELAPTVANATISAGLTTTVTMLDATSLTADVLNVVTKLSTAAANYGIVAAAGVETINLTVTDTAPTAITAATATTLAVTKADIQTATLTLKDAALKTITVTGNANLALTNDAGNVALTLLDASTATGVLTASTNGTVAQTIKGGAGNDVLLAATSSLADTLIGGLGNDSLTSNAGLTQMTGGAGVDTFNVGVASLNVNSYATITDASKGDIIKFAGTPGTFAASKVVLGSTAVFQDYANAATVGNASNAMAWFQSGGDTYIIKDVNASTSGFVNGSDMIVKLTGLVDLSIASYGSTLGTIELG